MNLFKVVVKNILVEAWVSGWGETKNMTSSEDVVKTAREYADKAIENMFKEGVKTNEN